MEEIIIGAQYMHFKGHIVKILCIARHTETEEEMVVYEEITGPEGKDNPKGKYWVRPKAMFLETVQRDGKSFPRFRLLISENK